MSIPTGYWSTGYWTDGYWTTGYWPLGSDVVPSGAYNLYIGQGHPDNIDYGSSVGSTLAGVETKALSIASLGLAEDTDYFLDVLAETAQGVESLTGGPVHIRIESGSLAGPKPKALTAARATAAAAGKVRLEAYYDSTNALGVATKIVVGRIVAGSIDWSSPVQEIAISGTTTIDENLSPTYSDAEFVHLAVRAETAAGDRGPVTVLAPVVADTTAATAPSAVTAAQES